MTRRIDGPIIIYGLIVIAGLVVSGPATYALVARYHSDGTAIGIAATVALLVILEVGAVVSKLATLWAPEAQRPLVTFTLAALGVNTLSNWLHGAALAQADGMHWLAAWAGALLYAAAVPALVFLMLSLIVRRVALLRGVQRTTADEVALVLRPVAQAVAVAAEAQRTLASLVPLPALPEPQADYTRARAAPAPEAAQPVPMRITACDACGAAPEAAQPVPMRITACDACGAEPTPMQRRTAAQHGGWVCKACGKKIQ